MNSKNLRGSRILHCILLGLLSTASAHTQTQVIDKHIYHLRSTAAIEWADIKGIAKKSLVAHFTAKENQLEQTLVVRQEDVKQKWSVLLNDIQLGNLQQDESSMLCYFRVPSGAVKNGNNALLIQQTDSVKDDIRVGEIILANVPLDKFLHEASIEISVTNRTTGRLTPSHLTLVNSNYVLQPVASWPDSFLAVRTGCIYTGNGKASFSVPAGRYTLYAGRGFQYGVDSVKFVVKPGDTIRRSLSIEKELPLDGWISCDTHIHTLTYSGHGDATMRERLITLAGEGIEFPVMTEHNFRADVDSPSRALQLRQYFTPVAGDEYTTPVGHFNIFPLQAGVAVPDWKVKDWNEVSHNLKDNGVGQAIILNHARDLHDNFRPFDARRHIGIAGVERDGWKFPTNSMEVINSAAQQFDIMQLYRDWFGMINHGFFLTPVGSSDSHDVSRYLVGQARTYIRYNGKDASKINSTEAIGHFLAGEVMVSFGLVTEMIIDSLYGPGTLAPARDKIKLTVKVLAPSWIEADSIFIFANGKKVLGSKILAKAAKGLKWQGTWTIPVSAKQDVFFVAVATGPDPAKPFWRIPKPFLPTSTQWTPRVIGSSGAIWIDANGDGIKTSAYSYALALVNKYRNDIAGLLKALGTYDESVSTQAASILQEQDLLPALPALNKMFINVKPVVRSGFTLFLRAIAESSLSN